MAKTIKISLDPASIQSAITELEAYQADLDRKCRELCKRLADMGATTAKVVYSNSTTSYIGTADWDVSVEQNGDNRYRIVANGATVLLLEFGAGVTKGYGHPQAGEFGYGPGTYPGQTHAMNPKGWYLPKDVQEATGVKKSYGNAPSMAMYNTGKYLENEVLRVAKEVFA